MERVDRRERQAVCGIEKAVRSACMERESVQECVRMRIWTRTRSERSGRGLVGEYGRRGGLGALVQGGMSGIGVGVCVWRCGGKGGGETVEARPLGANLQLGGEKVGRSVGISFFGVFGCRSHRTCRSILTRWMVQADWREATVGESCA